MTNHPNRRGRYELQFWGDSADLQRAERNCKRYHQTVESAEKEALRVLKQLNNRGAHPAIIYDGSKSIRSVQ